MDDFYNKYRAIHESKFKKYKYIGSHYYNAPDGQDLLGKLSYTTKLAALGGWALGGTQIVSKPPVENFNKMVFLCFKYMVPAVGMAAAFTTTTYYATNFRKKDDPVNYALGGIAAGGIFGAATKSTTNGIYTACFLAIVAYCKKTMKMNNFSLMDGHVTRRLSPYTQSVMNFSFWPERKGNWTSVPPSQ